MKLCSIDGCNDPHLAKDMCRKHYLRLYRTGKLTTNIRFDLTAYQRLMLKVKRVDTGCLLYTGKLTSKGYVHVRSDAKVMKFGHLIVYEHHNGPMPKGFETGHTCNVRNCLEWTHLKSVTHLQNIQYAVESNETWGLASTTLEERQRIGLLGAKKRWSL